MVNYKPLAGIFGVARKSDQRDTEDDDSADRRRRRLSMTTNSRIKRRPKKASAGTCFPLVQQEFLVNGVSEKHWLLGHSSFGDAVLRWPNAEDWPPSSRQQPVGSELRLKKRSCMLRSFIDSFICLPPRRVAAEAEREPSRCLDDADNRQNEADLNGPPTDRGS